LTVVQRHKLINRGSELSEATATRQQLLQHLRRSCLHGLTCCRELLQTVVRFVFNTSLQRL